MIEYLKKIQIEWELSLEQLSQISHVSEKVLKEYFALSAEAIEALPSMPAGLEAAMPLVSIYKYLVVKLPDAEKQNEWLVLPNELLEKNKPIEVMAMSPSHLSWLSYILASQAR